MIVVPIHSRRKIKSVNDEVVNTFAKQRQKNCSDKYREKRRPEKKEGSQELNQVVNQLKKERISRYQKQKG